VTDTSVLQRLVGGDAAAFLAQLGQAPWFQRGGPQHFDWLFSEAAFRELVARHAAAMPPPRLRLLKQGDFLDSAAFTRPGDGGDNGSRCLDVDKVWDEFRRGATISLNAIHKFDPRLQALADGMLEETDDAVQVNAYYSPPEARGFDLHFDAHDIIVLQLYGDKEWAIGAPTFAAPLLEHSHADCPVPDKLERMRMQQGDLLHLPRGTWHLASTTQSASLHLTIGLVGKTGVDLLGMALSVLKQRTPARLRVPRFLACESAAIALADAIEPLLHRLGTVPASSLSTRKNIADE
jgi:hypothetical protein